MNQQETTTLKALINRYGGLGVLQEMVRICQAEGQNRGRNQNYRLTWQQAGFAFENAATAYQERINGRNILGEPFGAVEVENDDHARELLARYRDEGLEFADERALLTYVWRRRGGVALFKLQAGEAGRLRRLLDRGEIRESECGSIK